MTKLPYVHWCYHLTDVDCEWRQVDYSGRTVVKGLKGEPFKGYMDAKVAGVATRFDSNNIEELIDQILPAVGRRLRDDIAGPISIVPIPNSGMALGAAGPFRSVELAKKVAAGFGANATVCEAIRWDAPRKKAHQNNDYRHPGLYEPHMRLVVRPKAPVVLFDDVLTSGSQMIAAARMLTKQGVAPERGLVVARATKIQHDDGLWTKRAAELDLSEEPFDFDAF